MNIELGLALLLSSGMCALIALNILLWWRERAMADRLRADREMLPCLSRHPKVSVLVAAWNEGEQIDAHIRSFLELRYPNIELILCAGGRDDTLVRAKHYCGERVKVLEQAPGEGKQKALARCIGLAEGEVIYLTDADCIYEDRVLITLLEPIVNHTEQATTGTSRPLQEQAGDILPMYVWVSDAVADAHGSTYSHGLLGRNAAVSRTALEKIGGLDFDAPTGTDYQLAQRLIAAGIAIRRVGASAVQSHYPESLREYRQKQSRWLRNLWIYGRRYGAWDDVRVTAQTIAMGVAMTLMPFAALLAGGTPGLVIMVLWLLVLTHAVAAKVRYALFTSRAYSLSMPHSLYLGIPPLRVIDFAILALPALDLLNMRRRHAW